MPAEVHALTPAIVVHDPRGLSLREVNYCRERAGERALRRVLGQNWNAAGQLTGLRDPRLWDLHAQDPRVPANLLQAYSLSGRTLSRDSVDSGFACTLFGEAGQALRFEDGKGVRREQDYDELLRPVACYEQERDGPRLCTERHEYATADPVHWPANACGRLLRHDDPAGSRLQFEYALGGEVMGETRRFCQDMQQPDWPLPIEQRDALLETRSTASQWHHGPLGDVLVQVDAAGHRRSIGLTVDGLLRQVRVQLNGGGVQTLLRDIRYDAFAQVEEEQLGNGLCIQRQYAGQDGQLLRLSARRASGEALQDLHYGYDPLGNVLSIEDHARPQRHFANQRIEPLCEYRYDSLGQLCEASGWEAGASRRGPHSLLDPGAVSNYRQSYRYDAAGNLLELVHVGAQAHGRTLVAGQYSNRCLPLGGDLDAGFDANGNLLHLQPGRALFWGPRNQLEETRPVTRADGVDDRERYRYDAAGQRVRKLATVQAAGRTQRREVRYLPGLELRVDSTLQEDLQVLVVPAGSCTVRILHWLDGRPAEVAQDQVRYALSDHLGSSSLELDAGMALISHEVFHPFGTTAWWAARSEVEAAYKTVRYSGQERDASGLYYYGARYYRADWQRWLNPDPAHEVDGPNLYRMVMNNPLTHFDDGGLEMTPARRRWEILVKSYNKPLAVNYVAPGIVRVRMNGGPGLFKATGFDLGRRFHGERVLSWLSVDSQYQSRVVVANRGMALIPLMSMEGRQVNIMSGTTNASHTAFINGGFYNYRNLADPDLPRSTPIGKVAAAGHKIDSIPLPPAYRQYYVPLPMSDKSYIHAGPVLSSEGEALFTPELLEEPKFQFEAVPNLPGLLGHSSHGNTRSGISMAGSKAGATRLAVGVGHGRGEESSGYTMVEWAAVFARLDRLNPVPGASVNLDGGSSSGMGVVSGSGQVLTRFGPANSKRIGNYLAFARLPR